MVGILARELALELDSQVSAVYDLFTKWLKKQRNRVQVSLL